ncbi:MAG: cytochrome c3 family protein [Deltaproteobacteria bacterium]|nr:cytochrome c3 family protein [Deltaproteobacteria bacterium]
MRTTRRWGTLFLFSLIVLIGISGGIVVVAAQDPAKEGQQEAVVSEADVVVIDNGDYEKDRRGPVRFTHKRHALDYGISCWDCHHKYEGGRNDWRPWDETLMCSDCHEAQTDQEKAVNLQKAFHANCKGCHESMAKEGKKTGPHRGCFGCHEKQ